MARTSSKVSTVDELGNVASSSLVAGYESANKDETDPATCYYGFIDSDGNWYVQRVTTTDIDFSAGTTSYATNWTDRANLVYSKFNSAF